MDKFLSSLFDHLSSSSSVVVAITGGGGKTTLMVSFASFLKSSGYSVLMSTSTKIESPRYFDYKADKVFTSDPEALGYMPEKGESVLFALGNDLDVKKAFAPDDEVLHILSKRYDYLLIEADGSRHLPMKIHTMRDPVVPEYASDVVNVFGVEGIGDKAYSYVFGEDRDVLIDESYLSWYFSTPEGAGKGTDGINAMFVASFKGAWSEEKAAVVKASKHPSPLFLSSIKEDELYGIC